MHEPFVSCGIHRCYENALDDMYKVIVVSIEDAIFLLYLQCTCDSVIDEINAVLLFTY